MLKRILCAVIALSCALTLLSACSGSETETKEELTPEEILKRDTINAYKPTLESTIDAIYLGNGQVLEYSSDSIAYLAYQYSNCTEYNKNDMLAWYDDSYVKIDGKITAVSQEGVITVLCLDEEATDAEGKIWPIQGFGEVILAAEEQGYLSQLQIDDEVVIYAKVDMDSYTAPLSMRSFDCYDGVLTACNGTAVEIPVLESVIGGITTPLNTEETEVVNETADEATVQEKPAQEQATNIYDTLSTDKLKKLNTFLSNFSEAGLSSYNSDTMNADELIWFAFLHDYINNYDSIIYNDSDMGITATRVDETLNKYMGKTVDRESTNSWTYDGTYYLTPAGDGESYGYFTTIIDMYDVKNGMYVVNFVNWSTDNYSDTGAANSKFYSYTTDEAATADDCEYVNHGQAVIKPVTYNGKETWQLVKMIESGEEDRKYSAMGVPACDNAFEQKFYRLG